MKILEDSIQISDHEKISWEEVETLKMQNTELFLVLSSGKILRLPELRQTTIDAAFRAYESYIKEHPHKRVSSKKTR